MLLLLMALEASAPVIRTVWITFGGSSAAQTVLWLAWEWMEVD